MVGEDEPEDRFSEKMTVVERAVYVDSAALPILGSALRKSPEDFLVTIDGAAAELVDPDARPKRTLAEDSTAEPEEDSQPGDFATVEHVIWLDSDLASPPYIEGAAELLIQALGYFPAAERISIVERSRHSSRKLENLSRSELAERFRRLALRSGDNREPTPTLEQRIAALNRLAVAMPRLSTQSLGALWLISEPWPIAPSEMQEILRADGPEAPPQSARETLQRTSRILASFGWVVFPIAARAHDRLEEPFVQEEGPHAMGFYDKAPSPRTDISYNGYVSVLVSKLFGKRANERRVAQKMRLASTLELATEIRLAPVAALARDTTGALAGDPSRVAQLADRLRHRRRLLVLDSSPDDEKLRRLEVVWLAGDGRAVAALPWIASRTPREIGIARLLSVVEQAVPRAGQSLRVRSPGALGATSADLCFAYPRDSSPVRILWWKAASQKVEFAIPAEAPQRETGCAALPAEIGASDVVLLEAMDSPEWGASQLAALLER